MHRHPAVNVPAVLVAGLTAFAFSLIWYSPLLFGGIWEEARGAGASMPVWKLFVAPLREVISAWVLAWLIGRLGIGSWKGATGLAFGLWLAFYVVQLAGAVIFDGMPPILGAVHAGDWLGKMLIMALILSAWHRPLPAAA
jgi:hypothetical protein